MWTNRSRTTRRPPVVQEKTLKGSVVSDVWDGVPGLAKAQQGIFLLSICLLTLHKHLASTISSKEFHNWTSPCIESYHLLFWPSHLNFKLLQKYLLCATWCYRLSPMPLELPLLDWRGAIHWVTACAEAVHREILWSSLLPSLNLFQICCSPFWEEELKCTEYARLPWLSDTANFLNPAAPRKRQTSWKNILEHFVQCCHKDSHFYYLIKG